MSWPWWTAGDSYADRLKGRAALFAHNRRIAAVREDWPDGTLAECERLDAAHPGWAVTWLPEGGGRVARWSAMMPEETAHLVSGLAWRRPWVHALTVVELEWRIGAVDEEIAAAQRLRDAEWKRLPIAPRRPQV